MITPMLKVTSLIFHKEKDAFLQSLQRLGVVHISLEKQEPSDASLAELGYDVIAKAAAAGIRGLLR